MDILDSFISSLSPSDAEEAALREYFDWQRLHRSSEFTPSANDDIDLQNYFLNFRRKDLPQTKMEEHINALKRFYLWAQTEAIISQNPFDDYNFERSLLVSEHVQIRQKAPFHNLRRREEDKLLALNQIGNVLNNSVDMKSALDNTLKTILKVMDLPAGWISMLANTHLGFVQAATAPEHNFILVAAYGLPPGLELDDRRFLRQLPLCPCQKRLIEGRMTQAINMTECSRLKNSLLAEGDNQGMRFHAGVPIISQGKPVGVINVATTDRQFLNNSDLQFLAMVSEQLVVTLERAHFYEVAKAQRIHIEHLATQLHEANQILEEKVKKATVKLAETNASLEKSNQQLKELDNLKSAFLGVVTHELRTPFSSMLLSIRLLEKSSYVENMQPKDHELVEQLDNNIEAAAAMIDNLVKYTSFIRKQGVFKLMPVRLEPMLVTLRMIVNRQIEQKGITLAIEISDQLPEILGDEERLADAIHELVKNAIKFTPSGGKITLRAWQKEAKLCFAVQDTGIGVPAEKLSTLWVSFSQVADHLQRGREGLGLGLAIVKYIIEAHNGEVWALSRVGAGSIFGFKLPLNDT